MWSRYPYYAERNGNNRPKRLAKRDDEWTDVEKEVNKKNKSINKAYNEYQLLWDDFMNTLRDIRERPNALPAERALYAAPNAYERKLFNEGKKDTPTFIDKEAKQKILEDKQNEERAAKAALDDANEQFKDAVQAFKADPVNPSLTNNVVQAGLNQQEAEQTQDDAFASLNTAQTEYSKAETVWTTERDSLFSAERLLYMKRWTMLLWLAEQMADNEYVISKNETDRLSRTSYIDSLLAMVFA